MASGPHLTVTLPDGSHTPLGPTVTLPVQRACGHWDWLTVQTPYRLPLAIAQGEPCRACRRGRKRGEHRASE